MLKLDNNGNVEWQKKYDAFIYDTATFVQETSDGGYIIAGTFGLEFWLPWLLKIDSTGTVQWNKIYGLLNSAFPSIQQLSDSGYIAAGYMGNDIIVVRMDFLGNVIWKKVYGGPSFDTAFSIQEVSNGEYIIAGYTKSFGAGSYDAWVLKLDTEGNIQWQKTYGSPDKDLASIIQQTNDSGYIIAGRTESFSFGGDDMWILKINSNSSLSYNCPLGDNSYSIGTSSNGLISGTNISGIDIPLAVGTYPPNIYDPNISTNVICFSSACTLQPLNNQKPIVDDTGSPTANNLIEPAETVSLIATLENTGDEVASSISAMLYTSSPDIIIINPNAIYPEINPISSQTCTSCYSLMPQTTRPATHWDFIVSENIAASSCGPYSFDYTYHVGKSFEDVAPDNAFYKYIETLLHHNIVSGCTNTTFCPTESVLRDQMANLICSSMNAQTPNSCSISECIGIFSDVPPSNIFCSYIEAIYNTNIISGGNSNPLMYCPFNFIQRQEMAKFVCMAMEASLPGSCITSPCSGIFYDVSSSNLFCSYIEALYNANVINGCKTNPLMYCPYGNIKREQVSKVLFNAFNLQI